MSGITSGRIEALKGFDRLLPKAWRNTLAAVGQADPEALVADWFQYHQQWRFAVAQCIVSQIGKRPAEADRPHPPL
jgi:hypothetical protein